VITADNFDATVKSVPPLLNTDPQAGRELIESVVAYAQAHGGGMLLWRAYLAYAQVLAHFGEHVTAVAIIDESVAGYRSHNDAFGLIRALNTRGLLLSRLNRNQDAALAYNEALTLAEAEHDVRACAHIANNLGLYLTYLGDYPTAIRYFEQSLKAWEQAPDDEGRGHVILNMGVVHDALGEVGKAEVWTNQALAFYEKIGNVQGVVTALCNLSKDCLVTNRLDDALAFARRAMEHITGKRNRMHKAHAEEALGNAFAALGRNLEARTHLTTALELYRQAQIPRGVAVTLRSLAQLAETSTTDARTLLDEGLDICRLHNLKPTLIDLLESVIGVCQTLGDWQQAFYLQQEMHAAERALSLERTQFQLRTMEQTVELERSRREVELQRIRSEELAKALAEAESLHVLAAEQSRQKTEILRIAAHDLRNLVGNVLGPAEYILSQAQEVQYPPDIAEMAGFTVAASHMLNETLSHLFDAAAIETGEITLKNEVIDLGTEVERMIGLWRQAASTKQQQVDWFPPNTPVWIQGDRIRLNEIVGNLLSNAIKYSPAASRIVVRLAQDETHRWLSVQDSGPGFTALDLELMGRPFQRLSAVPTDGELSIGLGLYIVKNLLALHGGRLAVECPPGGGSTFSVSLPREQPNPSVVQPA
jgi:signal transduction histidine kinase